MPGDIMPWVAVGAAAHAEHVAAEAREAAERAEALQRIRGFVSDDASVEQRRQYAEAVRILYPVQRHSEPPTRAQKVACGAAMLIWLIAIACGAVYRARNPGQWMTTPEAAAEGGFMVALCLPLACLIAALAIFIVSLPFYLIFGG